MVNPDMKQDPVAPCRPHRAGLTASIGRLCAVALAATWCVAAGCGQGQVPKQRVIPIRPADPLAQVRSYLESYAQGQPVGSERELFPQLVDEVRKTDPSVAGSVESGLAEIGASPAQAARIAKRLLERLEPAPKP